MGALSLMLIISLVVTHCNAGFTTAKYDKTSVSTNQWKTVDTVSGKK